MTRSANSSARLFSPSTARNRDPILAVLKRVLPPRPGKGGAGLIQEIASGTGEHGAHFAPRLPGYVWQPSDIDGENRASIAAWVKETRVRETGVDNLMDPVDLDVTVEPWPVDRALAVVCINMIHISPWAATRGLMAGAGRILPPGGILFLYGPYHVDGQATAPSNQSFDESLRRRNPEWGLRVLGDVIGEAQTQGLALVETVDMPANNLSVVLRKG